MFKFVHETKQATDKLNNRWLNSQALTAFGTARIDNGASTTCFHANQKAMGAGAACF
jgi:hypothetical protein